MLAFLSNWFPAATLEQGLVYGLLALGVFLTYRILNFADLTVDSSFTTGAGTAAILITNGANPWLATLAGFVAGACAGAITGFLHTKLKIDPLLSSILTMIALWSVNLRIMGKANLPLMRTETIFSPLRDSGMLNTYQTVLITLVVLAAFVLGVTWFLETNFGLAVQATGDNPNMATALGVSIDTTKMVTLMLSNGLVGLAGALVAQLDGRADISMGIGLILVGLASVIVGNAIISMRYTVLVAAGAVIGSVLYRLVIYWALKLEFVSSNDMKLITAVLVALALVLSRTANRKTLTRSWQKMSGRGAPEAEASPDRPEHILSVPGSRQDA